jgi:hypothetical protein
MNLTPCSRVLEKLMSTQLVKKFPEFYGILKFIAVFKRAFHWFLSYGRCIQSTPSHPISLRAALILFSHLLLRLPNGLFPSGFPTKILYALLISPVRAACPTHLIFLQLINLIILDDKL